MNIETTLELARDVAKKLYPNAKGFVIGFGTIYVVEDESEGEIVGFHYEPHRATLKGISQLMDLIVGIEEKAGGFELFQSAGKYFCVGMTRLDRVTEHGDTRYEAILKLANRLL